MWNAVFGRRWQISDPFYVPLVYIYVICEKCLTVEEGHHWWPQM